MASRFGNGFRFLAVPLAALAFAACGGDDGGPTVLPDLSPKVDPFIGTKGYGNTVPGAMIPRGMVKLSPDTNGGTGTIDAYDWDHTRIEGFTHTHLEGPGGSNNGYSQILVAAMTGAVATTPAQWSSAYGHDAEEASPGYYAVTLQDYGIRAELTATAQCGVHRYTFPASDQARLVVDTTYNRGQSLDGELTLVSDTVVEGFGKYQVNPLVAMGLDDTAPGTGEATVYLSLKVSRPFLATSATFPTQTAVGAHLDFVTAAGDAIEVRVGISYLSVEQARKNRESQCEGRTFEAIRQAAVDAWNRKLYRVEVTGGTADQQTVFYTALYHTWMQPSDYTEDGKFFSGWDLVGREVVADGWRYLSDDWCGWDTGRVTHPLHALLDPESRSDLVRSYLQSYLDQGWLAKASWNALGDSRCMTANFHYCAIADAYVKGFRDYDADRVWEGLDKGSRQDSENALQEGLCGYLGQGTPPDYVDLGFVSTQCDYLQGASMTLEYATNDACVANFADASGRAQDAAFYRQRAGNWKNQWDASTGFPRPRNRDGTWVSPFDPGQWDAGFCEADAWIYLWSVQHDVCGLVQALGGAAGFESKLDEFFTGGHFDVTNEPDYHAPFLYAYVGQAAKSQTLVRDILAQSYFNGPDGMPGNDDAGATSAWIAFAMLGLYPVMPSGDGYVLASPVFEKAVVHLDPERQQGVDLVIEAPGASDANRYVQSATWDDQPLDRPYLTWEQVRRGGTLRMVMGPAASTWGAALCP